MKIKYKFSLPICIVLILLGVILNISTRYVLNRNMEKNTTNYLEEIMNSTREAIKYRVATDTTSSKETVLQNQAEYINNYISLNYDCQVDIRAMNGEVYYSNIDNYESYLEDTLKSRETGQAIVNLIYSKGSVEGILSYPIYVNGEYLGIIDIIKNYDIFYAEYKRMINLITLIEMITVLSVLIAVFIMSNIITRPVSTLTKAVINLGEGNYDDNSIENIKGNDEVASLSKEFIKMKEKIKEQIKTINIEKDKVETLAASRKSFFDNVTHEIKTPLTAITGYSEMVKDNIVDDEEFKKKAIERIYAESERLNLLVLDLISVSKGLSFIKEEKVDIDMKILIIEVCEDINIKCEKYGLSIEKNISEGHINGQANKIRELLINIMDNAIKYSLPKEKIKINTYNRNSYYNIEVVNKAEPIPKRIYDNIFEPLVKSNNAKEVHSSGLGLFLCKEIVEEHSGEIRIINGNEIKVEVKIPNKN